MPSPLGIVSTIVPRGKDNHWIGAGIKSKHTNTPHKPSTSSLMMEAFSSCSEGEVSQT